jgi:ankyrin repeat protein
VDIIKLLLDKEMSVNLTNTNGSTPLHISAEFGHLEATKSLVERGASFVRVNKYVDTPLNLTSRKSELDVCRFFTEIGDDITIRNA